MRLSQKYCQPEFTEGYQIDCQYFGKLNMTINSTFETASFIVIKLGHRLVIMTDTIILSISINLLGLKR